MAKRTKPKRKTAYVVVNKNNKWFGCRVVVCGMKNGNILCERHGYSLEIPLADLKKESCYE